MNLLRETLQALTRAGKTIADIEWIGDSDYTGTWDDFAKIADFEYDAGYGGVEINQGLLIVGRDWWLERCEYDGSEWWEFKQLPRRPVSSRIVSRRNLLDDRCNEEE